MMCRISRVIRLILNWIKSQLNLVGEIIVSDICSGTAILFSGG